MSVHVFFSFSEGLAETLYAPVGTKDYIARHVAEVEETLGLKRTKYKDNPVRWNHLDKQWRLGFSKVEDEVLCETVQKHNDWVRWLYGRFEEWSANPTKDGEPITPDDAKSFFHALQLLEVRPERWTMDYCRNRMEHLYEVMRGRESEGVSLDACYGEKPLTPKQAGVVIRLFESYFNDGDLRLEVPKGCDYLASSYHGEYEWCSKCGAVLYEDAAACTKKKCPARERLA